jgi:hypothetical protein
LQIRVSGFQEILFNGEITAVNYEYGPSGERRIRVRGYDILHQLRKRQPVGAHVQVSVEELAQTLVADLGLRVEAVDPGPRRHNVIQYNQSDFELIAESAEKCGLYFTLRSGVLHLITLEGIGGAVALKLGSSLLEARIEVNTDSICRSVETTGWDSSRVKSLRGRQSGHGSAGRRPSNWHPTRLAVADDELLWMQPFGMIVRQRGLHRLSWTAGLPVKLCCGELQREIHACGRVRRLK